MKLFQIVSISKNKSNKLEKITFSESFGIIQKMHLVKENKNGKKKTIHLKNYIK